jgi:hypothetical protein
MNKWCTGTHYTIVCVVIRVGSENFLMGSCVGGYWPISNGEKYEKKKLKNDEKTQIKKGKEN